MHENINTDEYAVHMATQLRKGFLAYCVLKICSAKPVYTSDIISMLRNAELVVVEGTIYPLLSRLLRDGMLQYEWQESEHGPPRKYYKITTDGSRVEKRLQSEIERLNNAMKEL